MCGITITDNINTIIEIKIIPHKYFLISLLKNIFNIKTPKKIISEALSPDISIEIKIIKNVMYEIIFPNILLLKFSTTKKKEKIPKVAKKFPAIYSLPNTPAYLSQLLIRPFG
jgi:hypothetical protein